MRYSLHDETTVTEQHNKRKAPLHVLTEQPYLYGLNPEHPSINAKGLRDDLVSYQNPDNYFRMLVLADSIAYGKKVFSSQTFPNLLEKKIKHIVGPNDVINTGVSGYSPYNELHFYLTEGYRYQADVVLVVFCLNDIVNPRLHWDFTRKKLITIPEEAIPNKNNYNFLKEWLRTNSRLYFSVAWRVDKMKRKISHELSNKKTFNIPTYLTLEDDISIEVLMDRNTAEWKWLESIYHQLHMAVKRNKSKFVVVIVPLAYQLDSDYPFYPQEQFSIYCKKHNITCIDLLPRFKSFHQSELFWLNQKPYYDIWHLTELGHSIAADEILKQLKASDLLTVN